ncbi:MAG: Eco57I restriction-modification methylase domain-containing protein, partial [Candidatus Heimdallarchaeota archaeon]
QEIAQEKRFFHWEMEFPDVFFDRHGRWLDNPGFDGVVGNPPYVSFGLGRVEVLQDELENYYRNYFKTAEYKISVYTLFIERGLQNGRIDAGFGYIIPDSFLVGRYFSKLRDYILSESRISRLLLFEKDFWESGDVGFPVVIILKKESNEQVRGKNQIQFGFPEKPENLVNGVTYLVTEQNYFRKSFRNRFRLLKNRTDMRLIQKIEQDKAPLHRFLSMHHGIRSKVGRDKIISKDKKGDNWMKAIISSSEVTRYCIHADTNFIHVKPSLLFKGGWDKDKVERPKLLIRRTGDSIIAALDEANFYHTNALIYAIKPDSPKNKYSLTTFLALLNSNLLNYYYQKITMKKGRTLPQVEIDTVEQLPIPVIDLSCSNSLRTNEVNNLLEMYQNCRDKNRKELVKIIQRCGELIEKGRFDVIHDFLSNLAIELTNLNKQKVAAIDNFSSWLKYYLGIEENRLIRLILQGLLQMSLEKFIGSLSKHNIQLTVAQTAKIKEQFEQSVSVLKPLIARIEKTDWLIDQIVYLLYGLTEEEIRVVEGSVGRTSGLQKISDWAR